MKRLFGIVALGLALAFAGVDCGGSTSAFGHDKILLLGHDPDAARIFVWSPGSPVKPLIGPQTWGYSGGGDFFSGMSDGYWSPDGRSIAFEQDSPGGLAPPAPNILVMQADGTNIRTISGGDYTDQDFNVVPTWSPDGRHIGYQRTAVVSNDGLTTDQLAIVDFPSGREKTYPLAGGPEWMSPGYHWPYDGSPRAAIADVSPTRITIRSISGRVLERLPFPRAMQGQVCGMAWSPDGSRILAATDSHGLKLWVGTVRTKRWQSLGRASTWRNYTYDCAVSWR